MRMNKSENGRRVRTLPITVRVEDIKKLETAALVRELRGYQERIQAAHRATRRTRRLSHERIDKARERGETGFAEITAGVIVDMATDVDLAKILNASYIAKKLLASAALIDESRAVELAFLRSTMRETLFQ